MTPQDAITLLDKAVSILSGTREDHIKIQNAINVLKDLIQSTNTKQDEEPLTETVE